MSFLSVANVFRDVLCVDNFRFFMVKILLLSHQNLGTISIYVALLSFLFNLSQIGNKIFRSFPLKRIFQSIYINTM